MSRKSPRTVLGKVYAFCAETTVHGLGNIKAEQPRVVNVLWALVFLASLAGSLTGIVKVFLIYQSRPMSTDYRIVANNTMELPSLSVCAMSFISKTRMKNMGMSESLQKAIYYGLGFRFHSPAVNNDTNRNEYTQFLKRNNYSDFEDLLMGLSMSCEEMFSECSMGAEDYNCCTEMRQFLFPAKCITIAARGFRDPHDAWQYTVALNWPRLDEELMASLITARSREFSLMINRGDRAMVGAKPIGYASPGFMYTIGVNTRTYESVNNPPAFACLEDPDPDYDTDSCMEECTISIYFSAGGVSQCPCETTTTFKARPIKRDVANASDPDYKALCDPWELLACNAADDAKMAAMSDDERRAFAAAAKERQSNSQEKCQEKCPRTCKKVAFYANLLTTRNDPDIVADYLVNQGMSSPASLARMQNSSFVIVKYDEMEYKHTKQQLSMTGETVLSYLGGQLGLFLGGSLLTFAHFVVFIIQNIVFSSGKEKNKDDKCDDNTKTTVTEENGNYPPDKQAKPCLCKLSTARLEYLENI